MDTPIYIPMTVTVDTAALDMSVAEDTASIGIGLDVVIVSGEYSYYEGEYVITPSAADAIVLPTESKVMQDDVTVRKIPYYETSNLSGGLTAYIASEV